MNTDRNRQNESGTDDPESYPEQELTEKILASAFAVHNTLGAGFLERMYSNALAVELRARGVALQQEIPLKIQYRGTTVGDYVADLIVDGRVLIELKACASLDPAHTAQILNYLRASGIHVGLHSISVVPSWNIAALSYSCVSWVSL